MRLSLVGGLLMAVAAHGQTVDRSPSSNQSGARNDGSYRSSGAYDRENNRSGMQVRRLNKTSNLIGTEVRDQSRQRVGEVKDVVIDFNSGRVAYVVVDASEVLDGERSCIAVPARVLRVAQGENALTIEADRDRIEQMRAFSANNYPAIRRQSTQMANWRELGSGGESSQTGYRNRETPWNEGRSQSGNQRQSLSQSRGDDSDGDWYYYEWYLIPNEYDSSYHSDSSNYDERASQGGYGNTQSGGSNSESEYNRYSDRRPSGNSGERTDRNRDRWQEERSFGEGSREDSQFDHFDARSRQSATSSNSKRISGWIRSVDPENRTLIVESQARTINLEVANNAAIKDNGTENLQLRDLSPGERVDVGYTYRNGSNRAFTINQHTQGARTRSYSGSSGASWRE